MLTELVESIGRASAEGARVLVLRGAGEEAFCAGLDLGDLREALAEGAVPDGTGPLSAAVKALDDFPGPTLALLNGHAVGGGCLLALACDLRYAHPSVQFTIPATRLGIVVPLAGVRKLVALLGPGRALELIYTADPLGAEEGARAGLYNRVIPRDRLETEVLALAERVAARAPFALAGTRHLVNRLLASGRGPGTEIEAGLIFATSVGSADAREGLSALVERREPRFEGR